MLPYVNDTLNQTYEWVRVHTPANAVVLGFPTLCTYLPGAAGRVVWVGHWCETLDYTGKVAAFGRFADSRTPPAARHRFLRATGAQYLLYFNDVSQMSFTDSSGARHNFADFAHAPPTDLVPVYRNADYTLFQIHDNRH